MAFEPDSERPPDEGWWVTELHRNEKFMDKYWSVLGTHDKDKLKDPEAERAAPSDESDVGDDEPEDTETSHNVGREYFDALEAGWDGKSDAGEDHFDNHPPNNEGYPEIARLARNFAVRVFKAEHLPELDEVFLLSAGKIGANLAGGHGLGYHDESICGNIVKCRWALSDCEFCREILEFLITRTGRAEYREMLEECCHLSALIRERVERLRARVWW